MKLFNINPLYCFTILLCTLLIVSADGSDGYETAIPKTYYLSPKVREYTFYINRTVLAPDGFSRRVSTVNGQFPGPAIHAVVGDTVKVEVINGLDEPTTIHWHGISQKGTPWFDGVLGMTQCGIPCGQSLTYEFVVSEAGTYWWHSHYKAQYVDGVLGSLIVHDPKDPYLKDYDEEYTVLINWWYHDESSVLLKSLFSPGDGPEPNGGLINGRFDYNCSLAPVGSTCKSNAPLSKFKFEQGKKYRLRIINVSADGVMNFSIDKHILKVIEVDGFNVAPYTTHRIVTSPGQRYSVIVEANQPIDNYYMRADIDELDEGVKLNPNVTAIIQYKDASEKAPTNAPWDYSEILEDDLLLQPLYNVPAPSPTGKNIILHVDITEDSAGLSHGVVNNSSYIPDFTYSTLQKVYDNQNVSTANQNAITFDNYGEIIDFVMQNDDGEQHPFHMHGHKFWLMGAGNGTYIPGKSPLIKAPIQRDTSRIPGGGYSVFRIVANNPGVWGLHCHIEWHLELGMSAQLVELPSAIKSLNEPYSVSSLCPKT